MRVVLAIGVGLGGCLTEPGRPASGDGGGSGDNCHAIVDDHFDPNELPCQPWATAYGSAGVQVIGGELRVTPGPNGVSSGGCRNGVEQALTAGGILVEVTSVISGPGAYTAMRTSFGGVEMNVSDEKLRLFDNPIIKEEIPYVPSEMRWWRMHFDATQDSLVADYSPDGANWIELDRITRPITMTMPELDGGMDSDINPTPGYAAFSTFRICGI